MKEVYTLDELGALIESRFGSNCQITQRELDDGSSKATLDVNGMLGATWEGRLVSMPPRDGATTRGPSEYFNVRFYGPWADATNAF